MSTSLSDKDVADLRSTLARMVTILLAGDWDRYFETMTDDAVMLPPDEPAVEGKEAVKKWTEGFPVVKAFDSQLVQAEGRDDFAWAWGRYTMTVEPEPGKPMSLKGKWTGTYRKQADGTWLMVSDIWNLDETPKAG